MPPHLISCELTWGCEERVLSCFSVSRFHLCLYWWKWIPQKSSTMQDTTFANNWNCAVFGLFTGWVKSIFLFVELYYLYEHWTLLRSTVVALPDLFTWGDPNALNYFSCQKTDLLSLICASSICIVSLCLNRSLVWILIWILLTEHNLASLLKELFYRTY